MKKFSGNPRAYRKASLLISLYIGLSVYTAFSLIKFFLHDETWVFGWKPILITILFIIFFYRFSFRWTMRLDAQYGSGSSWNLVTTTVKLPEFRH